MKIKKFIMFVLPFWILVYPLGKLQAVVNSSLEEIGIHAKRTQVSQVLTPNSFDDLTTLGKYHGSHVSHGSHASHASHFSYTPKGY